MIDYESRDGPAADLRAVARMERVISRLLRLGVMASLALVVIGTALSFAQGRYGSDAEDVSWMVGGQARSAHEVTDGLRDVRGQAVIVVGLLLLIATPVLRVAVSIVAFAIERDVAFVVLTSVVLALLALSFVVGAAHG